MKILKLVLAGYKRLLLNNVHKLTYTPESVYQLILGTNGSGKSSVLYELSPLPAASQHYLKGGYKEITLTHGGHTFVLLSTFKSGNRHSFLKDLEELNPGGTLTVQKELVEQQFGLTQEIHELLIGETHFTDLSPGRRREWLTRLCDVDFTYALGVHQKLKTALRDAQGALKHTKLRVTTETNRLLAIGDLTALETQYQSLYQELDLLFRERDSDTQSLISVESQIRKALEEIEALAQKLLEKTFIPPCGAEGLTLKDLETAITQEHVNVEVQTSLRQRIGQEYNELTQLIQQFQEAGVEDLESVQAQCESLRLEQNRYRQNLQHWKVLSGNPQTLARVLQESSGLIHSRLQALLPNPGRVYTPATVKEAQERVRNLSIERDKTQNRIAQTESQIERLTAIPTQECPKCHHSWVPGLDAINLARYQDQLIALQKQQLEVTTKLDSDQTWLTIAQEAVEAVYALKQLSRDQPSLSTLWEAIFLHPDLFEAPHQLTGLVTSFSRELTTHVEIERLESRIIKLEKLLEATGAENEVGGLKLRLETLGQDIEVATRFLETAQKKHTAFVKYRAAIKQHLEKVGILETQFQQLQALVVTAQKAKRGELIESVIRDHQNRLAGLQSRRTEKQTLEGILKDLTRDSEQLTKDQVALTLLAETLSPTDGLIAEQLTGFIEAFVAHINQVISSVWTYELRVLPCGLESGELDYRFPLYVKHEGGENIAPDIVKGSEAQVEVVNLAFRLVVGVYLGYTEYPIYLDEIGRSFDEQHRINVMNFLKRLVDTGNYPQMFLISHYAAQYNVFTKPEVLVLDGTNILVPADHNTHAILE